MRQSVSIKKVSIDGDRKVSVLVEFLATTREGRDNVFSLIEMQGEAVEVSFSTAGQRTPFHDESEERAPGSFGV